MPQGESLAAQMRTARIAAGLTQAEAAKKLNISAQAISNFERGKNNLSPHYIKELCTLYGMDISSISDQIPSDAEEVTGTISALIVNSYAYEHDLLSPLLQCTGALFAAVDSILRQYKFCKESYELNANIENFYREYLSSPDSLRGRENYEKPILQTPPPSLIEDATIRARSDVIGALDTFSSQLQTMLEKVVRDTAHPESSAPYSNQ